MTQIDWNKFTFTDNLLFQRVMRDKTLCKYLIEHILNIRIRDIRYLETEKTLSWQLGKEEACLDIYLDNEVKRIYSQHFRSICLKYGRCFYLLLFLILFLSCDIIQVGYPTCFYSHAKN